jgi:hypothetical protein
MTDLPADDHPKGPRRRQDATAGGPVLVSAPALGLHLDLTGERIRQLAEDGIIERRPDGKFDQDDSRRRYLRWLHDPARRTVRSEAAADHLKAKTEMLQIKLAEKRRDLVRRDEANALLDMAVGITLTHLSAWPARIAGPNLELRRRAEALLIELRRDIANACDRLGDERGEPPLDQQPA